MVVYRIISFFVNVFCAFAAFSLLFLVFVAFAQPAALLQLFIMLGVALYGWFSRMFFRKVLLTNGFMTRRQKDWLQANAIVAGVFAIMGISNGVLIYTNPEAFIDLLNELPLEKATSENAILTSAYILSGFCLLLLIHIIWTLVLVRKNREKFNLSSD